MTDGIQTHKAKKIVLKEAVIDEKIKDVIKWINTLGCFTLYSCQGDDKSNHPCSSHPLVGFVCFDEESIQHITSVVRSFLNIYSDKYKSKPISLKSIEEIACLNPLSKVIQIVMFNESVLDLFNKHISWNLSKEGLKEISSHNKPFAAIPEIELV